MILDILGYVCGIGFVVFGISSFVLWLSEIYKNINKSNKKASYKKSILCGVIAVICVLVLFITVSIS